eukprot:COSAG04_NODE_834_length_9992_cov_54.919786_4_plen_270_part_00
MVIFRALEHGRWVGGVISKGGQEAQGGWVVPQNLALPQPQKHPEKSFACSARLFIGPQEPCKGVPARRKRRVASSPLASSGIIVLCPAPLSELWDALRPCPKARVYRPRPTAACTPSPRQSLLRFQSPRRAGAPAPNYYATHDTGVHVGGQEEGSLPSKRRCQPLRRLLRTVPGYCRSGYCNSADRADRLGRGLSRSRSAGEQQPGTYLRAAQQQLPVRYPQSQPAAPKTRPPQRQQRGAAGAAVNGASAPSAKITAAYTSPGAGSGRR